MMQSQDNESNQRQLKRVELTSVVDVLERTEQKLVGRLVNVHTEGLMIIGDFPFAEDTVYKIDLKLPDDFKQCSLISLDLDCLWTRMTQEDVKTVWSGFSIVDSSEQAQADLKTLIEAMDA